MVFRHEQGNPDKNKVAEQGRNPTENSYNVGQKIIDLLNSQTGQDSIYYYELVSDNYKPYSFQP